MCRMGSAERIETRKKIIKACAPLLNRYGYLSVSFSELEKASGETKTVLYGYFINKHALAMAVLDYNLEQKRNKINKMADSYPYYRDKLTAHISVYYPRKGAAFPDTNTYFFNAAVEATALHEDMRQRVAKALLLWKQDIVDIIRQGIATNEFKPEIQADETAWSLISLIESAVIISKTTQDVTLGARLLDQAKQTIKTLVSTTDCISACYLTENK